MKGIIVFGKILLRCQLEKVYIQCIGKVVVSENEMTLQLTLLTSVTPISTVLPHL